MQAVTRLLGIDIGTSSCKAIVIDETGAVLAEAVEKYPISHPHPMWSEQDPEDWWTAALKCISELGLRISDREPDLPREAAEDLERDDAGSRIANLQITDHRLPITAVALTGQMHGAVFLDEHDCVIRPAILWNDQRTAEECAEIERVVGAARVREITGNAPLTGFQLPKILWLRNHEPSNFARLRKVLLPKDYIRFRLTGKFFTEVSDASGTGLFDVRRREWSREMMSILDLDPALFPECVESTRQTGWLSGFQAFGLSGNAEQISRGGAEKRGTENAELGTPDNRSPVTDHSIPVFGGAGDQATGAVGTGAVVPGVVSVSLGTSGVVFSCVDASGAMGAMQDSGLEAGVSEGADQTILPNKFEIRDPRSEIRDSVHLFCHANGGWHQMGVMLACGGALSWYASEIRGISVEEVLAEAETAPVGADGLVFLPYLSGERSPHNDPNARGGFLGFNLSHSRASMSRAVVEGITFGLRDCWEAMKSIGEMGPPPPVGEVARIDGGGDENNASIAPTPGGAGTSPASGGGLAHLRVTGGGAKSRFWVQMIADVFQLPCHTLEADEGPAFGAAIIAGVGAGVWPSLEAACQTCIRVRERYEPGPDVYIESCDRYRTLYPHLKGWFVESGTH